MAKQIDTVTVEVVRNLLMSIAEETYGIIVRSAYSTNMKERRDVCTAVIDPDGNSVAQVESLAALLGSMLSVVPNIYEKFGKVMETLTVQSSAGQNNGETTITVTEEKGEKNSRFYRTGKNVTLPAYNDICNSTKGWTSWNGTDPIKAKTGDKIVIVEVDTETSEARKAGEATVAAKEAE